MKAIYRGPLNNEEGKDLSLAAFRLCGYRKGRPGRASCTGPIVRSRGLRTIGRLGPAPWASARSSSLFVLRGLVPGGLGRTTKPEEFESLYRDVTTKVFNRFDDETAFYPGHGRTRPLARSDHISPSGANADGSRPSVVVRDVCLVHHDRRQREGSRDLVEEPGARDEPLSASGPRDAAVVVGGLEQTVEGRLCRRSRAGLGPVDAKQDRFLG